jgi:hypothetical protein
VHTFDPTELWRLANAEGRLARAVVLPGSPHVTLTFFVDSTLDRAENFESMDVAIFRSDEVKRSLLADGWKDQE